MLWYFRDRMNLERERIIQLFFLGILGLIAYELYQLLLPFLAPIAWALLLAFIVHPAQLELRKYTPNRTATAAIITLVIACVVILPAIWLSSRIAVETQSLYVNATAFFKSGGLKKINDWIQDSRLGPTVRRISGGRRLDHTVPQLVMQSAQGTSQYLVKNVTTAARSVVTLVLDFGIVLMTFFYLLRDGEDYYEWIRRIAPLHETDKDVIFDTLTGTLSGVMRGLLLTAIIQGVAIGVGLLMTSTPYWAFLAVIAGICGMLPFGGTALVWVPAAIYLFFAAGIKGTVVLSIWCTFWLVVIDNFVKPIVMKQGTGLPTLALFFGIAGGLELYGPIGLFAGPAVISIFFAMVRVFTRTYGAERRPRRASF